MNLIWDDDPAPEGPFFTRDLYDKYSLAPHIRELWASLQSPTENTSMKQESDVTNVSSTASSMKAATEFKHKSEALCLESCNSDGPCADNDTEGQNGRKRAKKSQVKKSEVEVAYPEPRLPFPCMSCLSVKEQKMYVSYLMSNKTRAPPQSLMMRVNNEVTQFMTYLQDVAKVCADDYSFITQAALQYTEEFFRASLEEIKTLPQFYQIHEMTSLTGGTFRPTLTLTFEKQLLTMGSVSVTDHRLVPAEAQLASDYQRVSSATPPAKRAKNKHAMISSDGNAEKLCAFYEPHVCLTRDALVRLLDNHGPDFGEHWELPVLVKGSSNKKTVFIDSPLLKTEMHIRERSQIYHEESLKLSILQNGSRNVFHLLTEHSTEQQPPLDVLKRSCVSEENPGLDFEADLTDLETFGETASNTPKKKKGKIPRDEEEDEHKGLTNSKSSRESSSVDSQENPIKESNPVCVRDWTDCEQETHTDKSLTGDSDEEKLIIDDSELSGKQPDASLTPCSAEPTVTSPSSDPLDTDSTPPFKGTRSKRRRAKAPEDQLGEIMRMQTAMFKSAHNSAVATKAPGVEPPLPPHTTSLVKACVSSYLERHEKEEGESSAVLGEPAANSPSQHKILSGELQACAEDESDYDAPEEGNLFYKLYSLQELLLLVRSSVALTHTRHVGNQNQFVPVQVLPKLEYQLSYGVECLTSSEACQLWTDTLLHPTTVSYVAHINAHTSKVALMRKLPDNWMHNLPCGFKLSKSMNILHHLLKKLIGLEEGRYLIVHRAGEAFVTLLRASGGNVSRGAYDLWRVHGVLPPPPDLGHVPWIPLDPAVVLPFHQKHGRVPCTFPPMTAPQVANKGGSHRGAAQDALSSKKKGRPGKRSAKRNRYIKKLIQNSV